MKCFSILLILGCGGLASAQSPSEQLKALFAHVAQVEARPQDSLYQGHHPRSPWTSEADSARLAQADRLSILAERLKVLDTAGLTRQEQISCAVMRLKLADAIDRVSYRMHLIPFNAEGGFYNRLAFALPQLPFATLADYRAYLGWLPHYHTSLRENLTLLQRGVAEQVVAPRPVIDNTLRLLDTWAADTPQASPLFAPFDKMPARFSASETVTLLAAAHERLGAINETYRELRAYVQTDYLAAAPKTPGISALPKGPAYYANRVRHYTTLPLTVDSVHQLGLQEVARIRAAMEAIVVELGFGGSFADFLSHLRMSEAFYAQTPDELLHRAAWISKQAEAQLPKYFGRLYTLPFTVAPVPDGIAPTYTAGRYVGGSWQQQRPGTYWVNTYNLPSRPLYTLPALTLHEAVPGHHLQISLAAALTDLPDFRKRFYISAFGEGWGLYSEFLGEEMGLYTTPYERFGRLTYEMWRACRLVVDTGIHGMGWSRQQALDYLATHTALSLHEVRTEIDRYIGWPGQALSYKVGELHLKHLRQQAEASLGDSFDLRAFHDVVLCNGAVPLEVLSAEVNRWVAQVPIEDK